MRYGDRSSQVVLLVKNLPANAGDIREAGMVLGSGRSPEGGNGNPPQYSFLENCMNRDRSLAGSSPYGYKESNTKEETHHAHTQIWTQPDFSSVHEWVKRCIYMYI